MNPRKAGVRSVLAILLCAPAASNAIIVTIEPDNFPAGTDISHAIPGVTLSRVRGEGAEGASVIVTTLPMYSVEDGEFGLAPTGTRHFGYTEDGYSYLAYYHSGSTSEDFEVLRFDFHLPTDFVSVLALQHSDTGWMLAYDANGVQVASCQSGHLTFHYDPSCVTIFGQGLPIHGRVPYEMSFARERADIYSVVLVQASGPVDFDRFRFNRIASVPEPSSLALFAVALIGAGVFGRSSGRTH